MPKGPKGQKRYGEVIGATIMVAKIARTDPGDGCWCVSDLLVDAKYCGWERGAAT